jgi:DNA-binding beta-propeller fold protein YncE
LPIGAAGSTRGINKGGKLLNTIKKILAVAAIAAAMAGIAIAGFAQVEDGSSGQTSSAGTVHHYEYVFPDENLHVYDIDNHFRLVKHRSLPTSTGTRGAVASAATGTLYVSYGSDNSAYPPGSLLAYDLSTDTILWRRNYPFGIDSMSISPDGSTIYLPDGELTNNGIWKILDASNGNVVGAINSGLLGPHNTVVSCDGRYVFMGPRWSNYLVMADTTTDAVTGQIGPVKNGVRPFTINSSSTLAFNTTTGFLGFSVGDISTGHILYTIQVHGFPRNGGANSTLSHGISLSPDETEIYLTDWISNYVHVFDVSGLPASPPKQVADIALKGTLHEYKHDCAYDCEREGWLHHSHDGRYVFVGDAGDVIDTSLRKTVATLPAMHNSRVEIEIDMQNGKTVWAMNNRSSIGMCN